MKPKDWVIFDADNTLWPVEHLYDEARVKMCKAVSELAGVKSDEIDAYQQQRDKELHVTYGYSACRFARSFEDTVLHFQPQAAPDHIRAMRQLALNVFETKAIPVAGLDVLLTQLKRCYQLAILTAGEHWVQERRLRDFEFRTLFDAVEIVEKKSASAFADFCDRHRIARENSWMIGDSPLSDVLPALEVGLKAILVRAPNWDRIEGDRAAIPPSVPRVDSVLDIVNVKGILPT